MIEKIEGYTTDKVLDKLNELIDAFNELQEMYKSCDNQIGILAKQIAKLQHDNLEKCETRAEKVNFEQPEVKEFDPCAEAQKWVGCICRFWYDNSNDTCLDYLDKIQIGKDGLEYRGKETYDWFPYCEPVLPTDKAIYKGGKDEW